MNVVHYQTAKAQKEKVVSGTMKRIISGTGSKTYFTKWPVNSPDLSPIEDLWSIVHERLYKTPIKNLDDLKKKLVKIWKSIPKRLCEKLVMSFDKRIRQIKETKGERYNKRIDKKKYIEKAPMGRWNHPWNTTNEIENVVFNDMSLQSARLSAIRHFKKAAARIKKDFIKNILPKLRIGNLDQNAPKDVKKTFRKLKEEAFKDRDEKIKKLNLKADRIEEMSAEEFYRSLTPQRRFRLIRKGKKLKAYDKDETAVSDNEANAQNNDENPDVSSPRSDQEIKEIDSSENESESMSHKNLRSFNRSRIIVEDDEIELGTENRKLSEDFPEEGTYVRNKLEEALGRNILDECD
jgi:hypothetical protein